MSSSAAHVGKVVVALAAALLVGRATPALAAHRLSSGSAATHRLIVRFRGSANAAARKVALADAGVATVKRIGPLGLVVVRGTAAAEEALATNAAVAFAETDRIVHAAATPNDPLYAPAASPCSSSYGCWPFATLDLQHAWDTSTGSASVVVAVVDSGVDAAHPDLAGAVLPGFNVIAGTTNTDDDNGHGTMVAGVIAARLDNGVGIAGVCGGCSILPVKALGANGGGTTSSVAQGIQWAADHGARVINLSLAGTAADPALKSAIAYANTKGALVVAAAGNSGSSDPAAGSTGGYPGGFTTSIASGLVSVAGVDPANALYSYSNHGPWVTLAAPGAATVPTKDGQYAVAFGTSIAAPFVSGVAGLALSVSPGLSVSALQTALTSTVTKVSGLDDATGGVVDAAASLRSLAASPAPPPAPAPAAVPSAAAAPSLSGVAHVGHALGASTGTWSGTGTLSYRYQWQLSKDRTTWAAIAGATASTYTLPASAAGTYVRVAVTATGGAGSATAASPASDRVGYDAPASTSLPAISGSPVAGSVLSASAGGWSNAPAAYAYQWQSSADGTSWQSIGGAVHAQYAVAPDDVGRLLRVTVTAANAAGSTTAASAPTARVRPLGPSAVTAPALGGTPRVGGTLSASPGTWRGTTPLTVTFQWQVSANGTTWTALSGADAHLVVPASARRGFVRVRVTVSNAAGAATAYSAALRIAG